MRGQCGKRYMQLVNTYTIPKFIVGGVEDILGGYVKKSEPLRDVPKY